MKPLEFLGMIEEAAGTKMYDEKKEEAVKEIDRKQRKVVEFTDVPSSLFPPPHSLFTPFSPRLFMPLEYHPLLSFPFPLCSTRFTFTSMFNH